MRMHAEHHMREKDHGMASNWQKVREKGLGQKEVCEDVTVNVQVMTKVYAKNSFIETIKVLHLVYYKM